MAAAPETPPNLSQSTSCQHAIIGLRILHLAAGFLIPLGAALLVLPVAERGTYRYADGPEQEASFPLDFQTEGPGELQGSFSLYLPPLHPRTFRVIPDLCLEELIINGRAVGDPALHTCDIVQGTTLHLGPWLHAGTNTVAFRVQNDGGGAAFALRPSLSDPWILGLFTAAITGLLLCLLPIFRLHFSLGIAVFIGIGLRLFYTVITPHAVRQHDWEGHWEYVQYILTHWSIPATAQGWEFYHPPLYYTVSALLLSLTRFVRFNLFAELVQLQALATALSIAAFLLGVATLRALLSKSQDRPWLVVASLVLAAFPAWIFSAARINNDVLAHTLTSAWLLAVVQLGLRPERRTWRAWLLLCLTLAAGLLTKNTLLVPLLLTLGLLTVWPPGTPWLRRLALGCTCLAIVAVMSGWVSILRYRESARVDRLLIGNLGNLHSGLQLDNRPASLLSFNPAGILRHPYNNPWEDSVRRRYFWEYWFRSAFFGEFAFGEWRLPFARIILGSSLLLLPLIVTGLAVETWRGRWRSSLPLLAVLLGSMAAHFAFRIHSPYSSSQDFRYSSIIVVPAAYFAVRGSMWLPRPLRLIAGTLILLCVALWTGFILSLVWP